MFQFPEGVLDEELRVVAKVSDLQNISRLVREVICEYEQQEFWKALKRKISTTAV